MVVGIFFSHPLAKAVQHKIPAVEFSSGIALFNGNSPALELDNTAIL